MGYVLLDDFIVCTLPNACTDPHLPFKIFTNDTQDILTCGSIITRKASETDVTEMRHWICPTIVALLLSYILFRLMSSFFDSPFPKTRIILAYHYTAINASVQCLNHRKNYSEQNSIFHTE